MANLDLSKYGITGTVEVLHNPSYDVLFQEETKAGLEGFEKGQVTELGAVNVMTGIYTGRSPKDKFIVKDATSENTVWWTSEEYKNDNKPVTPEAWKVLKDLAVKELSNKKLFVVDGFCGANKATCLKVRFIVEVAWQAHFVTNMFIRATEEDLKDFEPDFVVYNASKTKVENYKELGLNSETAVVFNLTSKEQVIINTWYGGEMKKGMFSIMNYMNPLRGIASMHCSANTDKEGKSSAIFFGLSGTGKTTLSTDPKRLLIGDDEHGWDNEGVFNYEGGCYAKVINLDKESEPDIYNAIKRDALLENVTLDAEGKILWMNDEFLYLTGKDQKYRRFIGNIFPEVTMNKLPLPEEVRDFEVAYQDHDFRLNMRRVEIDELLDGSQIIDADKEKNYLIAAYLFDETRDIQGGGRMHTEQ